MPMTRRLPVVLTLALQITMSGCTKRLGSDVLWLPANATIEVNTISMKAARGMYKDGSADVVFTVVAPDATDQEKLTTELAQHFEQAGWRPRSTQWLNPGLGTSFSDGWTQACACGLWADS